MTTNTGMPMANRPWLFSQAHSQTARTDSAMTHWMMSLNVSMVRLEARLPVGSFR